MYSYSDQVRFADNKSFFRGNLHCHSTASDGKLSAEELVHRYQEAGYDFLSFTEHDQFTDRSDLQDHSFLVIPGLEWGCKTGRNSGEAERCHHINAIEGTEAMLASATMGRFRPSEVMPRLPFKGVDSVRDMLEYVRGHGCIAFYNHPLWSRVQPRDFGLLEGFAGIEVHNYGCSLEDYTGCAETYWDNLLSDGSRIYAVATDDNHNAGSPDDSFGGWIMAYAARLTRDAILQAIIDGDFYASTGPRILRYGILEGVAFVECTGVQQVNFVCGGSIGCGSTVWSASGSDDVVSARHVLSGRESYLRIRCQRQDGRTAWSQPLFPQTGASS